MPEHIYSYLLIVVAVYLFASIPWGLVIGKTKGIDIRKEGSGNIGATNVRRVLGKTCGRICFLLDFLKGLLPVLTLKLLVHYNLFPAAANLACPLAALAAVAGHNWSIYLGFKGGKGISTSGGALLALAPLSLLTAGIFWVIIFYSTRYVSLASISAALALPLSAYAFSGLHVYPLDTPVMVLLLLLAIFAVLRHTSNIRRLLNGTENRFESKKKEDAQSTQTN